MAEPLSGVLVSPAEVKEIYPTEFTDDQINAFINSAHVFVDPITGLTEDVKKLCELWLAAHFLSLTDQQAKSESFGGDYSVQYIVGTVGTGFNATMYGQQAIAFDTTGTLQRATLKKAGLKVWSYYLDD